MSFRNSAAATAVAFAVIAGGCGEGRKPASAPMKTEGPNQYVFAVPGMT